MQASRYIAGAKGQNLCRHIHVLCRGLLQIPRPIRVPKSFSGAESKCEDGENMPLTCDNAERAGA